MTLYAIGDIHGHRDQLRAAHELVAADRARHGAGDAPLVHVGDLVDRGPDSAGVVDDLMRLCAADPSCVVLMGNHDAMMVDFLADAPGAWLFPANGGRATLASYGVDPDLPEAALQHAARAAVPAAHRAFLRGLPRSFAHDGCFCVHAGIRPGVPLDAQDPDDLIWIRREFLDDPRDHGPLIVHGHSPVAQVEHHGNRLAIDTGAGHGRALSAVVIEGREAALLTPDGREPIRPMAAAIR
jgi:serine/threonine protein phosphatase 1